MGRNQGLAVGLLLTAAVIGAGLGWRSEQSSQATSQPPPSSTFAGSATDLLSVHVSGWVIDPGVVQVPDGAIVADAIEAAGGARPGADLDAVNLAQVVLAGDHIEVPGPGSGPEGQPATDAGDRISLNRATASDLEDLPGVGPVLADRIVAYRDDNGPFETLEDLLDVPGIGEAKLAAIRDVATVP